jgi:hypothetical protein
VELAYRDDDGSPATCIHCGALAVGPCARCDAPVCGDCCVLTEGGTKPYAICLSCDRAGGGELKSAWLGVIGWFLVPIAALALLIVVLALLFG